MATKKHKALDNPSERSKLRGTSAPRRQPSGSRPALSGTAVKGKSKVAKEKGEPIRNPRSQPAKKNSLRATVAQRARELRTINASLKKEIRERKRIEDRLQANERKSRATFQQLSSLIHATHPETGQKFLRSLVRQLATTLEVRYAVVGKCQNTEGDAVKTLAVWKGNNFAGNFIYSLKGTPCENVVGRQVRHYPVNVKNLFPKDDLLTQLNVESYLGVPLFDSGNLPLGILLVMHTGPIKDPAYAEAILTLFAARAESEIEREKIESSLKLARDEMELRVLQRTAELKAANKRLENEIRERKRSEEALRVSNEHNRRTYQQLSFIVQGTSATGDKFFPSLVQCLAFALEVRYAFIGRISENSSSEIQLISMWDGEAFLPTFTYRLENTPCEGVFGRELRFFPRDAQSLFPEDPYLKEWNIESYLGIPLFDRHKNPLGILGVMDVKPMEDNYNAKNILTLCASRAESEFQRTHMEAELERYRSHLEELVEAKTAELKATHMQLLHTEKLSATGKLAASMAHEFNNPIYGIRNVLCQIQEDLPPDKEKFRLVNLAVGECDRMTTFIRKLQDLHLPTTDIMTRVDLNRTIEDILLLIGNQMKSQGITLVRHLAPTLPPVKVVEDQIKQVLLNLTQNAREAIQSPAGTLTLESEADENFVIVRIRDTGAGIDPQHMDSLFDPFFTTKRAKKGTGLGLSVSYGIIKKHGGELRAESTPGKGSTFTFTLPIHRGES
ncbi:MAG: hypothetical protein COV67_15515 [Nitrospinae bacterium CG11_big_fil_rev_8_21_14_0_20_56_8]|nr:MAG: hypothetical protein COV67_15515 [Nitrospinae bacterium CG11_big_fil_rev_8_21_14_0_20_56_8]